MDMSNTVRPTFDTFMADLTRAAAKAGVSLVDTTVEYKTLDRTWGDLDGVVFTGPNAERASEFYGKWHAKHLAPRRSYDVQYSSGVRDSRPGYVARSWAYYPDAD